MDERRITIRFATEADDLTGLLDERANALLRREHILVAEDGRVQGLLVLYDGGSRMICVDNFALAPSAPPRTAFLLIRGLRDHCRTMGITDFFFTSTSEALRLFALRHGANVEPASYVAYVHV